MNWPASIGLGFLFALCVALMFIVAIAPDDRALAILLIYAFAATWFIGTVIVRGNRL